MFRVILQEYELKGIDITKSKNPLQQVKNQLIPSYKDYVMILMREMGMKIFETHKVKFSDFIDWYKINRMKKQMAVSARSRKGPKGRLG